MTTYQNIRKWVLRVLTIVAVAIVSGTLATYLFPKREVITDTKTEIIYKDTTIYRDTTIYKPYPVKVEVPVEVEYIPEDYDSLKTLYSDLYLLYNTLKRYEERILLDTIGEIDIQFTVSKNSLDSLNAVYSYRLYEKTIVETNYIYKNNWYIYGETNFNSVNLGILYTTNSYMVSLGYDFDNKSVQVGAGINISRLWK